MRFSIIVDALCRAWWIPSMRRTDNSGRLYLIKNSLYFGWIERSPHRRCNGDMAEKEKLNVMTDAWIAKQFREAAKNYDNRLGMCLSAAMLMFIRANPRAQGDYIRQVFDEQIREE